MEIGIGWLGVGVGFVGFIVTYLMARASARSETGEDQNRSGFWAAVITTVIFSVVFWAISMMKNQPFSSGQTLGYGFLIGGILGAFTLIITRRLVDLPDSSDNTNPIYLPIYPAMFLGLFGVSLVYSIFRSNPLDALIGFAIGTVMAAILGFRFADVLKWAAFVVTIAVAIVLAQRHFDQASQRLWWSVPILLAVTVLVAAFIGKEISALRRFASRPGTASIISVIIAIVLSLVLAALYSWKLFGTWQLMGSFAVGLAIAALIAWITAGSGRDSSPLSSMEAGVLSAILVVAFAVAAFNLWSGLGIVVGLIGVWTVLLPMEKNKTISSTLQGAVFTGIAILLFKLFTETYTKELRTTDLRIHYTFIGAVLGVIAPLVFVSIQYRLRHRPLLSSFTVGLFAAIPPILLYLIWGLKADMGFVFGLTTARAATFVLLFGGLEPISNDFDRALFRISTDNQFLLITGAQLVAIQFIAPLMDLELTRIVRIEILGGAIAAAIIFFVIIDLISRRRERYGRLER